MGDAAWICCRLAFHGRHREVWGDGYTELFFLDEATALAAGHRPCFECRRREAQAFAECWRRAFGLRARLRAADMDRVLHAERLDGRDKRLHRYGIDDLPDGAMVALEEGAFALRAGALLRWTPRAMAPEGPPAGVMVEALAPPLDPRSAGPAHDRISSDAV